MNSEKTIDLRGLCCAQPIIKLSKEMKGMQKGEKLICIADKISLTKDIPAFCNQTQNRLVGQEEENGLFKFWIEKE